MTTADPLAEAAEVAKATFQDLLTEGVPWEARMDAALHAYRAHLTASGCLTVPTLQPSADDLDEAAKWLAEQSDFVRYTDGDGWGLLRARRGDVETAYLKARDRVQPGETHLYQALRMARQILMAHAADTATPR